MARIDPDQAWFWTEEWQAGEREASEQLSEGEGIVYESTEAFLESLDLTLAAADIVIASRHGTDPRPADRGRR